MGDRAQAAVEGFDTYSIRSANPAALWVEAARQAVQYTEPLRNPRITAPLSTEQLSASGAGERMAPRAAGFPRSAAPPKTAQRAESNDGLGGKPSALARSYHTLLAKSDPAPLVNRYG